MSSLPAAQPLSHDASVALTNALKLGASLVVSFGITLALRHFLVPRLLGAERFGELNFAEGFAGVFLVAAMLGVDVWLRTELGVTPKVADGVLMGVTLIRTGLGAVLTLALVGTLLIQQRPNEIIACACIFAVAQLAIMTQGSAAAVLHAVGRVDGLSVVNVVSKLSWAAAVASALAWEANILWLAAAYAGSELFRAAATLGLVRRHAGLRATVDWTATWRAVRGSVSWWVNAVALAGTGRADVAVLGSIAVGLLGSQAAANREVGWYSAALGMSSLVLAVAPVITWVLLPLLSRAIKRADGTDGPIVRRALEACVVLGAPLAVGAYVAADVLMLLLKPEYLPASGVLRVMSWTYLLTYLNVVASCCLAAYGRGWTVAITSLGALLLTPAINFVAVGPALARWGPGGGALACAGMIVFAELVTAAVLLSRLGRAGIDARLVSTVLRTALTAAAVVGGDLALRRAGVEGWRLVGIDAVAYVVGALLLRSVRLSDVSAVVRLARAQREAQGALPGHPV